MLNNKDIRKLADYVLLNAYSVSSTGFYNGKAGMSLCLFEVARYLKDDYLENNAFELLQESLLSKNEDIGFENGLAGIGYVLQYLIDNELVDANFDEFFGEQTTRILNGLEKFKTEPLNLLNSLKVIHFLAAVNITKKDAVIDGYIKILFEAVELYLSMQFLDFKSIHYRGDKNHVVSVFDDYLRLLDFSGYKDFSSSLLASYATLYRQGKIASSYSIGFYLQQIASHHNLSQFDDIIEENKRNSIRGTKTEMLSLRERISLLGLLKQENIIDSTTIQALAKGILDNSDKDLEIEIIKSIPKSIFLAGYGHGVARLLRYSVKAEYSDVPSVKSSF